MKKSELRRIIEEEFSKYPKSKEAEAWDKLTEDERIDAILTAIDDVDIAYDIFDRDWEYLPPQVSVNIDKEFLFKK